MQIHYGVGEEAMLDCFVYEGLSEARAKENYFLPPKNCGNSISLVSYEDTPCFALKKLSVGASATPDSFVTLVVTASGNVLIGEQRISVKRGEKWFVPYGCGNISVESGETIVCYPPIIQ